VVTHFLIADDWAYITEHDDS